MGRTRALLTERERRVLSREEGDNDDLRYVMWEVSNRLEDELPKDIQILSEHHPDLLAELREVVCEAD